MARHELRLGKRENAAGQPTVFVGAVGYDALPKEAKTFLKPQLEESVAPYVREFVRVATPGSKKRRFPFFRK